jgi:RND family efflux transporter MFP subunit
MRVLKILLPLIIIAVSIALAKVVIDNPPTAKARAKKSDQTVQVEVLKVQANDYQINIKSYGKVQTGRESALTPQVAGVIIKVSENFENGGLVNKGDTILQIDPADYNINIKTAAASLTQARATLSEQQALSQEAIRDWKRLGRKGKPSDLVAHKPQLDSAKARVSSARAMLEKAKLDLSRTKIRAPYAGRIKNKRVGLGQYITPGTVISEIFSTNTSTIRLAISQNDLALINIPTANKKLASDVVFSDENQQHWRGKLIRSEGILDESTHQLYITASIINNTNNTVNDLTIGQFLSANIQAKAYTQVFEIPSSLLRKNGTVLLAKNNSVYEQAVSVIWSQNKKSIINQGLSTGDALILTPLGSEFKDLKVKISNNAINAENKE